MAEICEYDVIVNIKKGKRNMCKCGTKETGPKCSEKEEAAVVEQKPVCCSTGQVKAAGEGCCSEKAE